MPNGITHTNMMSPTRKSRRFALVSFSSILFGIMVFRDAVVLATTPPPITIKPVIGFTSMQEAVATIMSVVGYIGGLLCFFYLIWGAYKYLTAGDNAANTAAARQTMINAVIGLILLGMVVVIFNFVASFIPGLSDVF